MKILFLGLVVAMLVAVGSFAGAQAPDPSLVLSLTFDDGGGVEATDLSQYGNNGALRGDPEWVDGKFGKALKFDGVDDFVEVPHAEILTVDDEVTVMVWINAERHLGPGNQQWQGILAKSNDPRSYSLYTESSQALHFSTAGIGTLSTGTVPLNEWVHVAAVVEGGQHKYYINGEPAGVSGADIDLPGVADTASVVIGKTHEGSREFLGMIDEVRIWNRALDENEVKEEMDRGRGETPVEPQSRITTAWGDIKAK